MTDVQLERDEQDNEAHNRTDQD